MKTICTTSTQRYQPLRISKYLQGFFIVFFLISTNNSVLAQSENANTYSTSASIVGNWVFDFSGATSKLSSRSKSRIGQANKELMSEMETLYKGRRYTFSDDGTLLIILRDGRSRSGEWKLYSQGKKLRIIYPSGTISEYRIIKSNSEELQLKDESSNADKNLFNFWYLRKQ